MEEPIIFHIDVNSAFLSWTSLERLENGETLDLRLVPSIIGGDMAKRHGVVLAKSVPAKAYGIVTGEPVVNAFRKCPNLITAPPDHKMYSARSRQLMEYLMSICPDIEQVSIDECFMDFTPIRHRFASAPEAAAFIKDTVYSKFGFTVNVGISDRKVLAKMASDFKKPNLVHTLFSHEIREKLWPLPVSSLFLCGRSSAEALKKLGILTIGELAQTDPAILEGHLKSHGRLLWEYANGMDQSKVETKQERAKGIGNSTTLSNDVLTKEDAFPILLSLAESVSRRLRASHELAGSVCTEIKYATFKSVSHQTLLPSPTAATEQIYQTAKELFLELWDGTPVRLLGIRTTKLVQDSEPIQLSLFDYPITTKTTSPSENRVDQERLRKLDAALDAIRSRYGNDAVKRGSLLTSSAQETEDEETTN